MKQQSRYQPPSNIFFQELAFNYNNAKTVLLYCKSCQGQLFPMNDGVSLVCISQHSQQNYLFSIQKPKLKSKYFNIEVKFGNFRNCIWEGTERVTTLPAKCKFCKTILGTYFYTVNETSEDISNLEQRFHGKIFFALQKICNIQQLFNGIVQKIVQTGKTFFKSSEEVVQKLFILQKTQQNYLKSSFIVYQPLLFQQILFNLDFKHTKSTNLEQNKKQESDPQRYIIFREKQMQQKKQTEVNLLNINQSIQIIGFSIKQLDLILQNQSQSFDNLKKAIPILQNHKIPLRKYQQSTSQVDIDKYLIEDTEQKSNLVDHDRFINKSPSKHALSVKDKQNRSFFPKNAIESVVQQEMLVISFRDLSINDQFDALNVKKMQIQSQSLQNSDSMIQSYHQLVNGNHQLNNFGNEQFNEIYSMKIRQFQQQSTITIIQSRTKSQNDYQKFLREQRQRCLSSDICSSQNGMLFMNFYTNSVSSKKQISKTQNVQKLYQTNTKQIERSTNIVPIQQKQNEQVWQSLLMNYLLQFSSVNKKNNIQTKELVRDLLRQNTLFIIKKEKDQSQINDKNGNYRDGIYFIQDHGYFYIHFEQEKPKMIKKIEYSFSILPKKSIYLQFRSQPSCPLQMMEQIIKIQQQIAVQEGDQYQFLLKYTEEQLIDKYNQLILKNRHFLKNKQTLQNQQSCQQTLFPLIGQQAKQYLLQNQQKNQKVFGRQFSFLTQKNNQFKFQGETFNNSIQQSVLNIQILKTYAQYLECYNLNWEDESLIKNIVKNIDQSLKRLAVRKQFRSNFQIDQNVLVNKRQKQKEQIPKIL